MASSGLKRACITKSSRHAATPRPLTDHSTIFNTDLVEMLELDNMPAQATANLHSAIGHSRPGLIAVEAAGR
jgi:succinate dehydrogenase/fumarate reductase flavoprotein subunit